MSILKTIKSSELYGKIRVIYTCIYVTLFFLYGFLPFKILIGDKCSWLYTSIAVIGLSILAFDFFTNRQLFKIPFCVCIILFFISNAITIIINAKYGFMGNVKELLWMCVQIFLLATVFTNSNKKKPLKPFIIISNVFIFLQTIGAIVSFIQFVIGYGNYIEVFSNSMWRIHRIGFIEARLFGVYTDPNYACVLAFIAIGFIVLNIKSKLLPKIFNIYYIISIVFQVFYIILSGSRTGYIALLGVSLLIGGTFVLTKFTRIKGFLLKAVCFILAGLILASAAAASYEVVKKGATYLPVAYSYVFSDKTDNTPNEIKPPANLVRDDVENSDDISNNRFSIWKDYLKVFKKSVLFGTGSRTALSFAEDNFEDLYIIEKQYGFHNGYLSLLVAAGTIGASLMLYWLIRIVIYVLSYLIRRNKSRDNFYWPVFICTCILLIQAIFAFPLMALFYCNQISDVLFWVTVGFTLTFIGLSEPEKTPQSRILSKLFKL